MEGRFPFKLQENAGTKASALKSRRRILSVTRRTKILNAIFVSAIAAFLPQVELDYSSLPLVIVKYMEKNLGITKPRYREQILPLPCPFVVSRFHGNKTNTACSFSQPSRTMLTSMYLMPTFSLLSSAYISRNRPF